MIHEALKAPCLVALPWQNTQNLTFFINLILLHGAVLFSFEAGNQPFNRINTHILNMCNRSDVSLSDTCINAFDLNHILPLETIFMEILL